MEDILNLSVIYIKSTHFICLNFNFQLHVTELLTVNCLTWKSTENGTQESLKPGPNLSSVFVSFVKSHNALRIKDAPLSPRQSPPLLPLDHAEAD